MSGGPDRELAKVSLLQRIIRLEATDSPLGPDGPLLDLERSAAPG